MHRHIFFIDFFSNFCYDKGLDLWRKIADLDYARTVPSLCTLADTLYVFGGANEAGNKYYDSIESLVDPSGPTELASGVLKKWALI